jgi:hypothetical protein
MDAAGVVRSAPPRAGVEAGQRVAVLRSRGCWQEVLAAEPWQVLPLPDDMSFDAGAAAPLNYLTGLFAWSGADVRRAARPCWSMGAPEVLASPQSNWVARSGCERSPSPATAASVTSRCAVARTTRCSATGGSMPYVGWSGTEWSTSSSIPSAETG